MAGENAQSSTPKPSPMFGPALESNRPELQHPASRTWSPPDCTKYDLHALRRCCCARNAASIQSPSKVDDSTLNYGAKLTRSHLAKTVARCYSDVTNHQFKIKQWLSLARDLQVWGRRAPLATAGTNVREARWCFIQPRVGGNTISRAF